MTILFKKFIYDNRTHLSRINITSLINYLKSIEKLNKETPAIRISLVLISENGIQWSICYNNFPHGANYRDGEGIYDREVRDMGVFVYMRAYVSACVYFCLCVR